MFSHFDRIPVLQRDRQTDRWTELLYQYRPSVCWCVTKNYHTSTDIIQEILLTILTKLFKQCDDGQSSTDGLSVGSSERLDGLKRANMASTEYSLQPARNIDSAWTCVTITTACVNSDSDHIAPSVCRSFCKTQHAAICKQLYLDYISMVDSTKVLCPLFDKIEISITSISLSIIPHLGTKCEF